MTHTSEPGDSQENTPASARPIAEQEPQLERAARPEGRAMLAILRYAAPACAALALVLVMARDAADLDADLHVFVPSQLASSARRLPVRALRYGKLMDARGPVLVQQAANVELRTSTSQARRSARLRPAPGKLLDLEAELELPPLRDGDWIELVASLPDEEPQLSVGTHIQVADRLTPVLPEGRALRGLQQFAPGPILAQPAQIAPDALAVSVRGGACVPEQRCVVAVVVGSPPASLRVQKNSTVTPSHAAERGSPEISGVAVFDITTHGPEAELWLIAERAGRRVARRSVRLPIALGALSAQLNQRVVANSEALLVHSPAAGGGCIVDAFQAGHWRDTGSLSQCATPQRLPFVLGAGLWRLQLRRDALSAQTAAAAVVYVRAQQEKPVEIAAAWASAALQLAPDDAWVRGCAAQPERCTGEAELEYLGATLETGLLALPQAVTGYAARQQRVREQNTRMRGLALLALCLGALGLMVSVGRSGVSAGARASQLFMDDPGLARRARLRSVLLSGASAMSLLLVFAVLALYVLARGGY